MGEPPAPAALAHAPRRFCIVGINCYIPIAEFDQELLHSWNGRTVACSICPPICASTPICIQATTCARLRIARTMISDVIDTFGIDVSFSDESDDWVTVTVRANELAVRHFATRFVPDVVVESPQRLREEIKANLKKGLENYE